MESDTLLILTKLNSHRLHVDLVTSQHLIDRLNHSVDRKMTLVSAPVNHGLLNTRSFIPHRVHDAIGVLGSVSVATACVIKGAVGNRYLGDDHDYSALNIEHPTGQFTVAMEVEGEE